MKKVALTILGIALVFGASLAVSHLAHVQAQIAVAQPNEGAVGPAYQLQPIKLSITTGGGLFGPARNRFRVGEQIPVTITMTNTSSEPLNVCVSSTFFQDLPKVTKDGQLLPYMKWQSEELHRAQEDKACLNLSLPESILLKPNEPTVISWLILVNDAPLDAGGLLDPDGWYDPLPPGDYELSIQHRVGCCDGPMVESNKINFEVVQ